MVLETITLLIEHASEEALRSAEHCFVPVVFVLWLDPHYMRPAVYIYICSRD